MVKVEPTPIKEFHWKDIIVASRGNKSTYYFVCKGATCHDYRLIDLDDGGYLCKEAEKEYILNTLDEFFDSYYLLKKGKNYQDLIIR